MPISAPAPETLGETTGSRPFRLTREGFVAAVEAGAYGDRRMELVNGETYEIMGQNRPHRATLRLVAKALRRVYGEAEFNVEDQIPFPLSPYDMPEPDTLVLCASAEDLAGRDETVADIVLFVEIADSRLDTAYAKRARYALAGVPELWILNIPRRELEVYRRPGPEGYREMTTLAEGETVRVGGGEIAVASLLPPAARA